jgi:hypothetical protein
MTGGRQDAAVALRDADGRPVRVGRENDDVIVQVAKTAPRGRIRLDAAAGEEFRRALAAAEPPAGPRGGGHPGAGGGYPDVEAGVTEWLERFFWDLLDPVRIGGREFRSLYLEEARALGYSAKSAARPFPWCFRGLKVPRTWKAAAVPDLPAPGGPGPVREQSAQVLPPYSGPGGACPKCGQPGARTRWHWAGGALAPLEPDGSAPASAGPGIVDEAVTGEHLCRSCAVCGYGWPESCTVAGAQALTGLAPPAGCGTSLAALASGVLSGGAGFLLSPLLGGAEAVMTRQISSPPLSATCLWLAGSAGPDSETLSDRPSGLRLPGAGRRVLAAGTVTAALGRRRDLAWRAA